MAQAIGISSSYVLSRRPHEVLALKTVVSFRDRWLNFGQPLISWSAVGSDGLMASTDTWTLWINRSRHTDLLCSNTTAGDQVICGSFSDGSLRPQSAVICFTPSAKE